MILLAPWAKATTEGRPSPKNYPHWDAVVSELRRPGKSVVQISRKGEPDVHGCDQRLDDLPLKKIEQMVLECETWLSVDSFLQHLAWSLLKPGVVVFGQSDPLIFGHPENVNLLGDRRHLRGQQWWLWSQTENRPEAFVGPEAVVEAVWALLRAKPAGAFGYRGRPVPP